MSVHSSSLTSRHFAADYRRQVEMYMPAQLNLKVRCKSVKVPIYEEVWLQTGAYEVNGIRMQSKDYGT